jgi:DNA-binding beta-propeller fold protein YncE
MRCPTALLIALCLLVGCDDSSGDGSPETDAAVAADAGSPAPDAAAPDPDAATTPDAGGLDATTTDAGATDATPTDAAPPPPDAEVVYPDCMPQPPPEAMLRPGDNPDGTRLAIGGRALNPAGPSVVVEGFPSTVVPHPDGSVVYVLSASSDDRRLFVLDVATREVLQDLERDEVFYGLAIAPDGSTVYAAAGRAGRVEAFEVQDDRTLMPTATVDAEGYLAGLALSDDGAHLWVGVIDRSRLYEIETETMTVSRTIETETPVWDIVHLPARGELYYSDLGGERVDVVDLEAGVPAAYIDVPTSPAGLLASPDGARVWAAVSGSDVVAAFDTDTREVLSWVHAAEADADFDLATDEGDPLPNSNVNALAWDTEAERLYVSRGADNAVSVLNADASELLGVIPASAYPSDVVVVPGTRTLAITEGKGGGSGPGGGAKNRMKGSVTFVDLAGLDLEAATEEARESFLRPREVFPFVCDGPFPIPTREGDVSPIEHVILIVKENKTFDCVFGDLDAYDDQGVIRDPERTEWGQRVTPNQHKLAVEFAISDNFYTETPNSDTGHTFLTAAHLTEYAERIWLEDVRSGRFGAFPTLEPAIPDQGNWFTHLIDNDIEPRIYGEIVGMFARSKLGRGTAFMRSDPSYPGGVFTNYAVTDEEKVRYVLSRIEEGELARFTFLLLPNDHTNGTRPGFPTPESMIADNDYATGLFIEGLSRSPFWPKSAVFIVQDDPQGCSDSVDALRSALLVVSPWARRNYLSQVNASFISVFATMERILGVPPLGRGSAAASPLWDMFSATPDFTPFVSEPRIPAEFNLDHYPGAERSLEMDFRSPDREPELPTLLSAYRAWRLGRISLEEANRRIEDPDRDPRLTAERKEELEEEAEEESTAFDRDWARYQLWRKGRGLPPITLRR